MKCATKVDKSNDHCPEEGIHEIETNVYLCDKCYANYKRMNSKRRNYSAGSIVCPQFVDIQKELLPDLSSVFAELDKKRTAYIIGKSKY